MVRAALSNNALIKAAGVSIAAQGSYYNNTNVRLEADMDLRAVYPHLKIECAEGISLQAIHSQFGIYDTGKPFSATAREIRNVIIGDLQRKFGAQNVDTTGNKAIRLKKQVGTRADVDIVPAFIYWWFMWDAQRTSYHREEGVAILGQDEQWIHNFPEQHYTNAIAKRARTSHRFKRNVRILKHIRDELVQHGQFQTNQISSFFIECLAYAVEDIYFLQDQDDRYDRVRRLLYRMAELLSNPVWVQAVREINEIKYLFNPLQPWSVGDASQFVSAALVQLEA